MTDIPAVIKLLRRAAAGEDILADLRIGDAYVGRYVPDYNRAEAERRLAPDGPDPGSVRGGVNNN